MIKKHYRWFWIVSFFCFVLLISILFFVEYRRVFSYKVTAWDEDYRADCAVVLTGGVGRIREGFDLISRGAVRKLIISGVHPQSNLDDIFPQQPFYGGDWNEKDVILEKHSRTTYGNAVQTYHWVKKLSCGDLVLITSYLHIYRAKKVFEKVFPLGYPIYISATVVPSASLSDYALEVFKSLFYSLWAY